MNTHFTSAIPWTDHVNADPIRDLTVFVREGRDDNHKMVIVGIPVKAWIHLICCTTVVDRFNVRSEDAKAFQILPDDIACLLPPYVKVVLTPSAVVEISLPCTMDVLY